MRLSLSLSLHIVCQREKHESARKRKTKSEVGAYDAFKCGGQAEILRRKKEQWKRQKVADALEESSMLPEHAFLHQSRMEDRRVQFSIKGVRKGKASARTKTKTNAAWTGYRQLCEGAARTILNGITDR